MVVSVTFDQNLRTLIILASFLDLLMIIFENKIKIINQSILNCVLLDATVQLVFDFTYLYG